LEERKMGGALWGLLNKVTGRFCVSSTFLLKKIQKINFGISVKFPPISPVRGVL
jgi:hypothetical protein